MAARLHPGWGVDPTYKRIPSRNGYHNMMGLGSVVSPASNMVSCLGIYVSFQAGVDLLGGSSQDL